MSKVVQREVEEEQTSAAHKSSIKIELTPTQESKDENVEMKPGHVRQYCQNNPSYQHKS